MQPYFQNQLTSELFKLVLYPKCVDKQLPLLSGKSLVFVSIAQTPDSSGVFDYEGRRKIYLQKSYSYL